jgi:hypothetical protein
MFEIFDLNSDLNFFGPSKDSGKSGNPNGLLYPLFPEKLG